MLKRSKDTTTIKYFPNILKFIKTVLQHTSLAVKNLYNSQLYLNGIAGWPQARDIFSDSAVLMDADTGTILFDKSMDRQMYPASVTKLMTILLALENGNLDDPVAMTETGTAYCVDGSSNLYTQQTIWQRR